MSINVRGGVNLQGKQLIVFSIARQEKNKTIMQYYLSSVSRFGTHDNTLVTVYMYTRLSYMEQRKRAFINWVNFNGLARHQMSTIFDVQSDLGSRLSVIIIMSEHRGLK